VLLDLLIRARDTGSAQMERDAQAVERLATVAPLPLPDALAVSASLLDDGIEIALALLSLADPEPAGWQRMLLLS
jgi:class I lanthipeptide synthase